MFHMTPVNWVLIDLGWSLHHVIGIIIGFEI